MDKKFYLVLCTCPDSNLAHHIANQLLEQRLAACVNILPGVTSLFTWENKITTAAEILLFIKTQQDLYPQIEAIITRLHSYKVPEIIAIPIQHGLPAYLHWLAETTHKE